MPEIAANSIGERLSEIAILLRQLVIASKQRPARLLRTSEAARYLRASKGKVLHYVASGELTPVRLHDSKGHAPFLFDIRDLDQLIEKLKF